MATCGSCGRCSRCSRRSWSASAAGMVQQAWPWPRARGSPKTASEALSSMRRAMDDDAADCSLGDAPDRRCSSAAATDDDCDLSSVGAPDRPWSPDAAGGAESDVSANGVDGAEASDAVALDAQGAV